MGELLTLVVIAAISVFAVWAGIDGLRNPGKRVLNVNTGTKVPAGCSAPFMLLFGLGGLFATALLTRAIEPVYWWVAASVLGPVLSLWPLLFVLPLGGGIQRWLPAMKKRLDEGHPPHHLVVEGNSAAKRVLRAAFGVEPPETPRGGGLRRAPTSTEEYRERVREETTSTMRRWRRLALLAWTPSLVPLVVVGPLWLAGAELEASAWYTLLGAGVVALLCALLLVRVLRQIRAAGEGALDLLLPA